MQKRSKFQIRSDAAKQRWVRDDKKESFWRDQIQKFKKSGLSKRAFCIQNNLSQSSFNAWSREIGLREREKVPTNHPVNDAAPSTTPASKNPFVPLRLISDEATEKNPKAAETPDLVNHGSAQLEVLVPGGAIIRVTEKCDLNFVAQLFQSLRV